MKHLINACKLNFILLKNNDHNIWFYTILLIQINANNNTHPLFKKR